MRVPGSVLLMAGGGVVLAGLSSAMRECPESPLAEASVSEVQGLLEVWSVDHAFAAEFEAQQVDGFKLALLAEHTDLVAGQGEFPRATSLDWLSLKAHVDRCATEVDVEARLQLDALAEPEAVPRGRLGRRRRLGASAADLSGIFVERDDSGVVLGKEGDVQLLRTGAGEMGLNASVEVWGDLTVDGHVHLHAGNVSAANIDELSLDVNSLFNMLDELQSTVEDMQAAIDEINATASDATCCEANAESIDELFDAVALLSVSVDPYGARTVYESNFDSVYSEWTFDGADRATVECGNFTVLGGNLDDDASIHTYLADLPAHTKLIVTFTFAALDSWDGETAHCSVDGQEIWADTFKYTNGAADVCGYGWNENFLQVTEEVDHFSQGALISFTATTDQAYTDETWGVADITVETQLTTDYGLVYFSDFDMNSAAGWTFFGGADATTTTCGDHEILGGYDVLAKGGSVVKRFGNLDDHTQLIISFEWVKIDTWDGEYAKLFVDDNLVWSQSMDKYVGDSSFCGNTGVDAVVPITVKVPHDESAARLRFTSTLDQGATDEAWGLRSVSMYTNTPEELVAYESNFEEGVGDWVFVGADAATTTCGSYSVLGGYGILDYTDYVELYLNDLTPHTKMKVEFDFAKIDSWDGESAKFYIDDELVWTQRMYASDGEAICGGSSTNWYESFVPVSIEWPHYAQSVSFKVQTTLNQAATDESWGIANFKVTTTMEDGTEIKYASDFHNDLAEGWALTGAAITNNVTKCGEDYMIGGPKNFGAGATATKVVDLESSGQGVLVAFTFVKIDSWDTEYAQLYADGVLVWSEALKAAAGNQICGQSNTNWNEQFLTRTVDLGWMNKDSVKLQWKATINSAANDESWGLMDVDVYTYEATDKVAFQSNFKAQGDDGWLYEGSDGGTTVCDGTTLLGGYNILDYTDIAQKLAALPLHTSMQVDFTFAKIDSWDSEYVSFFIDYERQWYEKLSGGSSNICGNSAKTWTDDYIEKTFVVDHFSPHTWLQWQSSLSSGGADESWGLANVKITTFMSSAYTPVYESRFEFEQLDNWVIEGIDDSNSGYFTSCSGIHIFGGIKTFSAGTSALRTLYDLPAHSEVTVGVTWARIDSWDNEYFYIYADGDQVYSQKGYHATGEQLCGSGSSSTSWTEQLLSVSTTFDHIADSLELEFTTNLNSGGGDESWGLVGVYVYVN